MAKVRIRNALLFVCLMAIIISLNWGKTLRAQGSGCLPGDKIMDKYIKATGGMASYDKINNRITWSTLDIKDQNLKLAITTYAAKPNKILIVMDVPGVGRVERGMSEGVVWERTPKGVQIKTDKEAKEGLRDANFDKFAYWKTSFNDVQCIGVDTVDGHSCFITIMTPRVGDPLTVHIDRVSGLILKIDFAISPKSGLTTASILIGDYRDVDGILIPFMNRMRVMNEERVMTVDSLRQNVNIPDSLFALPTDVRVQMKVKK